MGAADSCVGMTERDGEIGLFHAGRPRNGLVDRMPKEALERRIAALVSGNGRPEELFTNPHTARGVYSASELEVFAKNLVNCMGDVFAAIRTGESLVFYENPANYTGRPEAADSPHVLPEEAWAGPALMERPDLVHGVN